jgi:hypothetical protein
MLSHLKQLVKEHESDITLTIGIILVALISFGAGQLTAPQTNKEPIVIQGPTASIEQSVSEVDQSADKKTTEQGKFVGSVNSNKYHWPDCPWVKKITPQNQIWFSSEAEAQTAGYVRCGGFEKYIPTDYKP